VLAGDGREIDVIERNDFLMAETGSRSSEMTRTGVNGAEGSPNIKFCGDIYSANFTKRIV
jgi:L-2-hydroxyglutarate oxidase LhgO